MNHDKIPAALFEFAAVLRKALLALLISGLTLLVVAAIGAGTAFAQIGGSFPGCPRLHEGDSGPCVTKLQNELDRVHPEYNLYPDGKFGSAVRIALLDFQGRNHLGADGTFGPITAAELQRQFDAAPDDSVPTPGSTDQTAETSPSQEDAETSPSGATGPNAECLNQGLVRNTETGACTEDGAIAIW